MENLKEAVREEEPIIVGDNKESKEEGVWEPEMQKPELQQGYENNLCSKEILQLKGNSISRGLIPLEKLFNLDDVAREPQLVPNYEDIEEVNIGT